ncbi:MAG: glycoside hydrolase family 3 protein, partial [Muribaculaceae bacterium]|nr:glycoside hydrolase family 3 protein [Muribaculaceae bacterium]
MNHSFKICTAGVISILGTLGISAQTEIYKDPAYSADQRADDLLKRLTLEEKVSLMRHNSPAIPRLGIPEYNWWNEDLHGVARAGVATVFPQTIGMAASFDPDALYTTFDIVSTEQRAKYNEGVENGTRPQYSGLTVWTPNINIFRDPRWGRGMETYGEDPYLTSVMGAAVVRGLQGDPSQKYNKLHACAKHFAVHSGPEWNRHEYNAENISKKDLWETYLPAFKVLVCDEGVKEVMCAYNRFEGEPCCASKTLLKQILRDDWKYDDVVVSDCGAISDFYRQGAHLTHPDAKSAAADAVLTGNDLECV